MKPIHRLSRILFVGSALILAGAAAHADQDFDVTMSTSLLATDYTGPFGIDFELIGSNSNTVILSRFSFGAGSAGPGSPFLTGGATGSLAGAVSLSDISKFFSDFNQQFTPGTTLTFTVDTTIVPPPTGGTPDNLSMVLFSSYDPVDGYNPFTGTGGTPITTTDPSGVDTFFNFNINGPGLTMVNSYPSAAGDIPITITPAGVVPEPSGGLMMALGALVLSGAIHRHGRRAVLGHRSL